MSEIFFPDFDEILLVHAEIIKSTGGSEGLRDAGGLDSALKAAENRYNYETQDLAKLAATYAYHLSPAHAFVDGNKRIAAVISELFLKLNNVKLTATNDEIIELFLNIASSKLSRDETEEKFAEWLVEMEIMIIQNDLFSSSWELKETNETLDGIKREMIEKAKQIPALKDEFFVFSQGKPNAKIAVVGESPGPPDADSEKPFQGPTGDLLNRILSSIGLSRENTYLTNIVKHISGSDDLTPDIIKFYTPYVFRELAVVKPKVVIALGNTPAQALLSTKKRISKIRGEFQVKDGFTIMPTFNPAYLLRDPSKKREVWEDMKQVRDFLKR